MQKAFIIEGLDCAHCAAKVEEQISAIDGVKSAQIIFMTKKLILDVEEGRLSDVLKKARKIAAEHEDGCVILDPEGTSSKGLDSEMRQRLIRIIVAFVLFVGIEIAPLDSFLENPYNVYAEFALFLVPYLIAGYDVLARAVKNIAKGNALDECFLMVVATLGAFGLVFFPDTDPHMAEGAAVMIFYQVGEFFQDFAVERSRSSIKQMMDIVPDYANVFVEGTIRQVDPNSIKPGDRIIVKPGERVPLDGVVLEGETSLDTSALTGEAAPRGVEAGDEIISGCVNLTGVITVEVTKAFGESTVSRILELVEKAAEKKARTEAFITRFARYYTPIVVGLALVLAIVAPLFFGAAWGEWIERALCFLVVSCPCALVISVPLTFFGGIGGASKLGVLIKGSSYLEVLSKVDTVVFDKTGTLTTGTFQVTNVCTEEGFEEAELLRLAAHAESLSDHPIAVSVREAWTGTIDAGLIANVKEKSGHGVEATVEGRHVLVGNDKLMKAAGVDLVAIESSDTLLYVAVDGTYAGCVHISDLLKPTSLQAIEDLHSCGIKKTVMLTGDREKVAASICDELGIDEYRAQLLPQDKVSSVEGLLASQSNDAKLAFVGDGINDAPVLMRADIGIAMGAMGSDAAIEAADVVLMDDNPRNISKAIRLARKTMSIVMQNIVFAIGVKVIILILAAVGLANMWIAVFGDVGVCVIAILNAMRAMRVKGQ